MWKATELSWEWLSLLIIWGSSKTCQRLAVNIKKIQYQPIKKQYTWIIFRTSSDFFFFTLLFFLNLIYAWSQPPSTLSSQFHPYKCLPRIVPYRFSSGSTTTIKPHSLQGTVGCGGTRTHVCLTSHITQKQGGASGNWNCTRAIEAHRISSFSDRGNIKKHEVQNLGELAVSQVRQQE